MKESLEEFLKNLGENIAAIRKEKGLSQIQLADEMDMERSNLRRIEAGRTNLTVATLYRISKALNIRPEELFRFRSN